MTAKSRRFQFRCTIMLPLVAAMFVLQPACEPGGGMGSNSNTNDNTANVNDNTGGNVNANDNRGLLEAEVIFVNTEEDQETDERGGLKIVAISQEGQGITGSFFAFDNGPGVPVTISSMTGDTDRGQFTALFDDQTRLERVTIDETVVDFDYMKDDTFTYSVSRAGMFVISGVLDVPRPNQRGHGLSQRIDPQDIAQCSSDTIETVANLVVQDLEGDPMATAEKSFVQCLQDMIEVPQVSSMVCTSDSVLIPALDAVLGCKDQTDAEACEVRSGPAKLAAGFFSQICTISAIDVVRQLKGLEDVVCAP